MTCDCLSLWSFLSKVDAQVEVILEVDSTIERLHTSVSNVDVGRLGIDALLAHRQQPLLDVALEVTPVLVVGGSKKRGDGDAGVRVLALVQFPPVLAVQTDGSLGPGSIADGKLTTFVAEPEHEFLCVAGGRITLCVRGHEVVADVALVQSLICAVACQCFGIVIANLSAYRTQW